MATNNLTTASVLAFERNLDISDAFLSQTNSENTVNPVVTPIIVNEKSVRGTISNRLKNAIANDPAKLDAEIEKPNLQKVDVAALDADNDTLTVKWSLKLLPFNGEPNVCNNPEYKERLMQVVNEYVTTHGLGELARRYAVNIANARWLWRNRLGAESIDVEVTYANGQGRTILNFENSHEMSLNDFSVTENNAQAVEDLANLIEQSLSGNKVQIVYIEAKARIGYGQETYPSQELILDTAKEKSKVLYVNNDVDNHAGMHSQKIGNAIRTIDDWYEEEPKFPIAVEPYGSVTTLGKAYRQPKNKIDFYTLFDNWVINGEVPETAQQHYVMAVLIRGGVFGKGGKE
jgi:CRISPR-associated protein Csy3